MNKNRILTTFLVFTILMITVSCSTNQDTHKASIIKEAELTDREKLLIKGTGVYQSFIFEYQENQNIENIDVWIEKYLGGKKIGPILKTTNPVSKENKKYIMCNFSDVQEDKTWSISFIEGENISTGKINSKNDLGKTSTWDTAKSLVVKKGEYILAVLVGNDGNKINGIPNKFFTNSEKYLDEILSNDYVYLLKIKLY